MKRKGALPHDGVKQWCAPKTHFTAAEGAGMIRPVADAAPTMPNQRHTPQTQPGGAGSPQSRQPFQPKTVVYEVGTPFRWLRHPPCFF